MKVQLRTFKYRFPDLELWLDGIATLNDKGNFVITNATGNVLADNLTMALMGKLAAHTDRKGNPQPLFREAPEKEMSLQEMYEKLFEKG